MRIEKTLNGYRIVRGLRALSYFSFLVDGRPHWSKHTYSARVFNNTQAAQETIDICRAHSPNPKRTPGKEPIKASDYLFEE